ncbi:hypothetical protein FKW77_010752 [Venturia effusa]|uniref:SGNH hydrolase-type esterase domain-containing protein n=1 Tax=Venturia effusa TaxID=50376 RepID=A0A517KYC2_9PEZI|nr:hypothetical protein FKW77_010752 [Venturia effusa]
MSVALCAWTLAGNVFGQADQQAECKTSWPGWKAIKYMFIFGDSYTQTGFDISGIQPSLGNPLGNPPYPGWTSCNGPNWVDYLTVEYNSSNVLTYNVADGGATIDATLVKPWKPEVQSLTDQVHKRYLSKYGSKPPEAPWAPENTLFVFWIGINDVGNSYWGQNNTLVDQIYEKYLSLIEEVYGTGARNFLFMGVPPMQRAPLSAANKQGVEIEAKAVLDWNARLVKMSDALRAKHPDMTSLIFQTADAFNRVLDDPTSYPQTKNLKDTTDFCGVYPLMPQRSVDEYTQSMIARDTVIPHGTIHPRGIKKNVVRDNAEIATTLAEPGKCKYKDTEYFWYNNLHPTSPIHEVVASEVAKMLAGAPSNVNVTCVADAQAPKMGGRRLGRRWSLGEELHGFDKTR